MKVSFIVYMGVLIGYVSAQNITTSVYIPGTDPQPLSVDILGVGTDGATTYRINPIGDNDNSAPETLVANSSHASLYENGVLNSGETVVLDDDCVIGTDGIATCTASINLNGHLTTVVQKEIATPIAVLLGSVAPTQAPNPGSTPAAQPSSTSSTGSGPQSTTMTNGGLDSKSVTTGLQVLAMSVLSLFGTSLL